MSITGVMGALLPLISMAEFFVMPSPPVNDVCSVSTNSYYHQVSYLP